VRVRGESVVGKRPFQINRRGLARTFQNIRLFKALTALDNVRVAVLAERVGLIDERHLTSLRALPQPLRLGAHFFDAINDYRDWWRAFLRTRASCAKKRPSPAAPTSCSR